jgi:phage terminase Nu1 subunit (DNA packaging protein)
MKKIDELLEKVPQSVKDKFLMKKRERAIDLVKEDLKKNNKSVNDYDHDEMEGLIGDAEKKLNNDQLVTLLITVATLEGLTLLAN